MHTSTSKHISQCLQSKNQIYFTCTVSACLSFAVIIKDLLKEYSLKKYFSLVWLMPSVYFLIIQSWYLPGRVSPRISLRIFVA